MEIPKCARGDSGLTAWKEGLVMGQGAQDTILSASVVCRGRPGEVFALSSQTAPTCALTAHPKQAAHACPPPLPALAPVQPPFPPAAPASFHCPSSLRAVGEASAPYWGAARLHSPVSRPPASRASSTRLPEAEGRPAPGNPSSRHGGHPEPPPHVPGPTLMSLATPKSPTLQMLLAPTRMFLAARSRWM